MDLTGGIRCYCFLLKLFFSSLQHTDSCFYSTAATPTSTPTPTRQTIFSCPSNDHIHTWTWPPNTISKRNHVASPGGDVLCLLNPTITWLPRNTHTPPNSFLRGIKTLTHILGPVIPNSQWKHPQVSYTTPVDLGSWFRMLSDE